jgi:murein DD-endopeptidase MepM/ murein hydrolase activator NlpD
LEHQLAKILARQAARAGVGGVRSGGGFVFPLPSGAAVGPGSWSQDQGVDIAAPGHTPLLAVGSGTVVLHGIGGFGPSAPVLHLDSGRYVYYGHAGPGRAVPIGRHVGAGQVIGEVGAGIVGISTGPHLEIGFSDGSGTPAPGTSGQMLALLHAAYGG